MGTPEIGIGSTVWQFDRNRRIYRKNEDGDAVGAPIFREYFRPIVIDGETSRSWLLLGGRVKIPKSGGDVRNGYYMTSAAVEEACWMQSHAWRIKDAVGRVSDPGLLRQIAALVGYDDKAGT